MSEQPVFHISVYFNDAVPVWSIVMIQRVLLRPSFFKNNSLLFFFQGTTYVPKTPQDEEEDKILEAYLTGMRIEGDQLRLPPASELQDGFDLFYKRRSRRKTYQYQMSDGEQFSLTVCKDQATNVCPYEPDASSIDDISPKVFHLYFYNCLAQKLL